MSSAAAARAYVRAPAPYRQRAATHTMPAASAICENAWIRNAGGRSRPAGTATTSSRAIPRAMNSGSPAAVQSATRPPPPR